MTWGGAFPVWRGRGCHTEDYDMGHCLGGAFSGGNWFQLWNLHMYMYNPGGFVLATGTFKLGYLWMVAANTNPFSWKRNAHACHAMSRRQASVARFHKGPPH